MPAEVGTLTDGIILITGFVRKVIFANVTNAYSAQGKRMKAFRPRECQQDMSQPVPLSSVSAEFRL